MLKFLIKEATVLLAFVVLGGLMLLCVWLSMGINSGIISEYRDAKVSVIVPSDKVDQFRSKIERDKNVIRYNVYSALTNKERMGDLYPELKSAIAPLETRFFPTSAIVTVKDLGMFLKSIESSPDIIEKQVVHEPPLRVANFLKVLTGIFLTLWILTLVLVLYFNIERLAVQQEARWSLMKMLGAKTFRVFTPLWLGQTLRIVVASSFAIALASLASQQVRQVFAWNWPSLSLWVWTGFFVVSLLITWVISFSLFQVRFRRITLG